MKLGDLPEFTSGDIVEIFTHNISGTSKEKPLDEGQYITNATRRSVAIILSAGTSEQAGYGDFIRITDGMIGDGPTKAVKLFIKNVDEVKVYPRQT